MVAGHPLACDLCAGSCGKLSHCPGMRAYTCTLAVVRQRRRVAVTACVLWSAHRSACGLVRMIYVVCVLAVHGLAWEPRGRLLQPHLPGQQHPAGLPAELHRVQCPVPHARPGKRCVRCGHKEPAALPQPPHPRTLHAHSHTRHPNPNPIPLATNALVCWLALAAACG